MNQPVYFGKRGWGNTAGDSLAYAKVTLSLWAILRSHYLRFQNIIHSLPELLENFPPPYIKLYFLHHVHSLCSIWTGGPSGHVSRTAAHWRTYAKRRPEDDVKLDDDNEGFPVRAPRHVSVQKPTKELLPVTAFGY